jgi:hypothetical protein
MLFRRVVTDKHMNVVSRFWRPESEIAWIVKHYGLDPEQVKAVLSVEMDYLWSVGNGRPSDWNGPQYYRPGELDGEPTWYSGPSRIAGDAERLVGVPYAIGLRVLEAANAWVMYTESQRGAGR